MIYKSERGFVDLEFPKYGDRVGDLMAIVGSEMDDSMKCWETGKSASVRITNEKMKVDFKQGFNDNVEAIDIALRAVSSLCDFASKLNYIDLY